MRVVAAFLVVSGLLIVGVAVLVSIFLVPLWAWVAIAVWSAFWLFGGSFLFAVDWGNFFLMISVWLLVPFALLAAVGGIKFKRFIVGGESVPSINDEY
ncbi:hypothetical protein HY250_02750 [Candidatus Azambacteria bacterium]|nr:hypothetical protein [Candidatus Azambacteria bacterium]